MWLFDPSPVALPIPISQYLIFQAKLLPNEASGWQTLCLAMLEFNLKGTINPGKHLSFKIQPNKELWRT